MYYSTSIEAPKIVPMFPAYYIFNSLLILLLFLHAIWTYLILKIAYRAFNAGQVRAVDLYYRVHVYWDIFSISMNKPIHICYLYANLYLWKNLQMEGDIRSNSSDEVSDTSVNNTPINNTANYINKSNSKPKTH